MTAKAGGGVIMGEPRQFNNKKQGSLAKIFIWLNKFLVPVPNKMVSAKFWSQEASLAKLLIYIVWFPVG